MCGIGLIIAGAAIKGDAFSSETNASLETSFQQSSEMCQVIEITHPDVEDLCGALKRRGPDQLGGAVLDVEPPKQHVKVWQCSPLDISVNGRSGDVQRLECGTRYKEDEPVNWRIQSVIDEAAPPSLPDMSSSARLYFIGATLQLRGEHPVKQPLEDSAGNLLVYNGEIFDGLVVNGNENDAEILMSALYDCCGCNCHSSHPVSQCECTDSESHQSVPQVLSKLRGPWALIYWQAVSQTLWFGRDAIGRRSLLIHLPSADDPRFLLTSVAPDVREDKAGNFEYWEDLICGIYSVAFSSANESITKGDDGDSLQILTISVEETHQNSRQGIITGWSRKHCWEDQWLRTLLAWDRQHITPDKIRALGTLKSDQLCNGEQQDVNFLASKEGQECHNLPLRVRESALDECNWQGIRRTLEHQSPVEQVLAVLRQAVKRRTIHVRQHRGRSRLSTDKPRSTKSNSASTATAPIAVLFSGGLDSMILAALADQFVDSQCIIDLLNVSFEGDSAPDRITAVSGVAELQRIYPSRRWRLVEVDAKWSDLQEQRSHLQSLICPSNTYMDLNIGTALWLASSGNGQVCYSATSDAACLKNAEGGLRPESSRRDSEIFSSNDIQASSGRDINTRDSEGQKYKVKSEARVLLVGSGADEQCGGYGRHRTKFRLGGWTALEAEMRLDFNRIWKRNLGRDDRCIADLGKEARFPFLDEDVISTLLSIPLWDIVDLQQPAGVGDKKILRQVAQALGLTGAASLPKRAIQVNVVPGLDFSTEKYEGFLHALNLKRRNSVLTDETSIYSLQFGSRIAQASNCRDFGSNRAANLASAGSATLKLP